VGDELFNPRYNTTTDGRVCVEHVILETVYGHMTEEYGGFRLSLKNDHRYSRAVCEISRNAFMLFLL
jgi:hypothetical protein